MQGIKLFHSCLFTDKLEIPAGLDTHILSVMENDNSDVAISNRGGWQSPAFTDPNITFAENIFDEIKIRVTSAFREYGINKSPVLSNYWFNVNPKYSWNMVHEHPFSLISAVLYVRAPNNCGNLIFSRQDLLPHYIIPNEINDNNWPSYWVKPIQGTLLLFPSYMSHHVEQNLSEDEDPTRISIALNYIGA
jgi:uncharacterized protein (TIGR02466 family)